MEVGTQMQRPWGGSEPSPAEKQDSGLESGGRESRVTTLEDRAEVSPSGGRERAGIWHHFGVADFRAALEAIVLEHGEGWGQGRSLGSHLGAAPEAQAEGRGDQDGRETVRRPRSGAGPQESAQRPQLRTGPC